MKRFEQTPAVLRNLAFGLCLLACMPAWSQTDNTSSREPVPALVGVDSSTPTNTNDTAPSHSDDRMLTSPVVSGQAYPTSLGSGERSNYLRGGLSFTTAYTDNVLGTVNGTPVPDVSYSVFPTIALNETTSLMHTEFTYAPGFTFYQRVSARNEADQNASINFQYRLSPHVTFSAQDGFRKSSNVFNQSDVASSAGVSAGAQVANFSVIAPTADSLSNSGNVGFAYQFARNAMIGVSGTFSNLHYPNPAEVPGLYDSNTQAGSAFYSIRISKMHYVGAAYQYQRLVSYPAGGLAETQTHAALFFYTVYPATKFSISFFGGPQHSDTMLPPFPPLQPQSSETRAWAPAAGASLSWQGRLNSFSLSYAHIISGGGGLISAVKMDNASAAFRQQITKTLSGSLSGGYVQNDLLGRYVAGMNNGHSVSGTASLQQMVGEHWSVQLGYSRIHQDYSGVTVLALTPDTNREFVSVSYQFSRPLGR